MFGFAGRWRPLLYCVFAFYESNLTYVTVPTFFFSYSLIFLCGMRMLIASTATITKIEPRISAPVICK